MTLVVTGGAGHLGRRTVELLLADSGDREPIVLVTRRPDAVADLAQRGADVRHGDFDDPATLRTAFAGGDRLLLISTDALDRRLAQHRAAIDEARAAGVRHVLYTSVVSPEPPNPAVVADTHHATEEALRSSGLAWTLLRNNLYAEFQVPEAQEALRTGELVHNRGDGRVAYVSREDCAAAAAAALRTDPGGGVHDITGPEAFDGPSLAALYSEIGGRPVRAVPVGDEQLLSALAGEGADGHQMYGARLVVSMGQAAREGRFAKVSDAVQALTGRPPRTLREILAEHHGNADAPVSLPVR